MYGKTYLSVAFSLLFQTVAADITKTVPVFIVDIDRSLSGVTYSTSPFSTLDKTKFSAIIEDALSKADRIIVFVEDLLSPEDLSSKDKLGSPYILLRQGLIDDTVKHFPSVDEPFGVLKDLIPMTDFNTFRLDDRTSKLPLYDSNMKHIYVFFNEGANSSRVDVLRQHDLIMREVHSAVKQMAGGPVVAFYTGKVNANAVGENKPEDSPWRSDSRRNSIWCRNSKIILAVEGIRIFHKNKAIALPPTDTGEVACTYHWNRDSDPPEVTVDLPLAAFTLRCKFTYTDVAWTLVSCQLRLEEDDALRSGEGAYLDIRRSFRYADTYYHTRPFDFRRDDGNGVVVSKITVEVTNKEDQKKFSIVIEPTSEGGGKSSRGKGGKGSQEGKPGDEGKKGGDGKGGEEGKENKKGIGGKEEKEGKEGKDGEEGKEGKEGEDGALGQGNAGLGKGKTPPLLGSTKEDKEEYIFTEPLLTCFFITSILLSILIYGLVSLADVNTNSKYDDPRSKPLMFAES